ncbi:RNA methyltransferase [Oscillibacter sp.]|uniref:TrmH family RNA methyltransferase n=1 Tax=Oscillibacter sp. TaxID=1945593 RepID=UPI002625AE2A|nr:RNA methyltransferase [Oscillibacter sp.]MDD3347292.1 RNA methyltransferase [Oscillibacter sp.]
MENITSRTNPLCTHLRKLASSASYRRRTGEFLCDSPKLLEEALAWEAPLHTVVFTENAGLGPLPEGVRQVLVSPELMAFLSPMETPQGVLAVCGLPEQPLPETLPGRRYVVLDGVQDPGNVGTILRTADAFHADGLFLVNACADLYNPKTVRSTMGAVFRCPVWKCTPEALRQLLTQSGLPLYGAALRADTADARTVDYTRCVIAIGSEGQGLSSELLALCDKTVLIPMSAHCESLNAAAAAAVLLWEAARGDGREPGLC